MRKLKNEELDRLTTEEFKEAEKIPVVILLDNIRSMNNVGSAFRTSDAFLIEKIFLCGITAKPPHRDINKTALGATDTVAWEHADSTAEIVSELKRSGYRVLAVEQAEQSTSLYDFVPKPSGKYCFIFGNEVFGVSQEVVDLADEVLEIPQFGSKHSFNISVTMGMVLWDYMTKCVLNK